MGRASPLRDNKGCLPRDYVLRRMSVLLGRLHLETDDIGQNKTKHKIKKNKQNPHTIHIRNLEAKGTGF